MACHLNVKRNVGLFALVLLFAGILRVLASNENTNYVCLLTNWVPTSTFGTNCQILADSTSDGGAVKSYAFVANYDTNCVAINIDLYFHLSVSNAIRSLVLVSKNCSRKGPYFFGNHIGDVSWHYGDTNRYSHADFVRNNVLVRISNVPSKDGKANYIDDIARMIDAELIRMSVAREDK